MNLSVVIEYEGLHRRLFVEADRLRVGLFNYKMLCKMVQSLSSEMRNQIGLPVYQ